MGTQCSPRVSGASCSVSSPGALPSRSQHKLLLKRSEYMTQHSTPVVAQKVRVHRPRLSQEPWRREPRWTSGGAVVRWYARWHGGWQGWCVAWHGGTVQTHGCTDTLPLRSQITRTSVSSCAIEVSACWQFASSSLWASPAFFALPCSPELVTTSDSKHQSALDQHGHEVEHSTRHVWGAVER